MITVLRVEPAARLVHATPAPGGYASGGLLVMSMTYPTDAVVLAKARACGHDVDGYRVQRHGRVVG